MKQFIAFIHKEFLHVLRDRRTLLMLVGMPLALVLIFGFALSNEIKQAKILLFADPKDATSLQIIHEIQASSSFEAIPATIDPSQLEETFKYGHIKAALIFPNSFEKNLQQQEKTSIQLIVDATDPNYATSLSNYLSAIINKHTLLLSAEQALPYHVSLTTRLLYNPELKGAHHFVPGVIALVLMLVCVMMTAVSIVREKENGNMEVLLVSPCNPLVLILSKTFPYLILSLVNIASILLVSTCILDVPVNGSLLLLFAQSTLFIITCLSLGIFISMKVHSQQVALLISLMGMLLPTLLFSGFMFPIENMPVLLQLISNILPAKWFYIIVKSIMIKGLGFEFIWKESLILLSMTIFFLLISIKSFKTRLA